MSDHDDFGTFLIGFIVGGVAGAVAALLLAPQSGEETRTMIRDKSIELRDKAAAQAEVLGNRASEMAQQAQERTKEIAADVSARSKDLMDSAKKAVSRRRESGSTAE